MQLNAQEFTKRAVEFIRETVSNAGFKKVIVAVSGGVDSATTLALCARALGEDKVLAVMLPYGGVNKEGLRRAKLVVRKVGIPPHHRIVYDIKKQVDSFLSGNGRMDKIRRGNIMARVRMILLYDLAKKQQALVCGTENKSEYLLGYFTRFGDEASDLEPLRNLYKTQVYRLAQYLEVPQEICTAPPTAGLWEEQTDAGELGFSYRAADPILQLLHERKMTVAEIVNKKHYNRQLVEKVNRRVASNKFKHRLPYLLDAGRVGRNSLLAMDGLNG